MYAGYLNYLLTIAVAIFTVAIFTVAITVKFKLDSFAAIGAKDFAVH